MNEKEIRLGYELLEKKHEIVKICNILARPEIKFFLTPEDIMNIREVLTSIKMYDE